MLVLERERHHGVIIHPMKKDEPNRIRAIREQKGLTQEQLAALMNTSHQQVGRLEKGARRLSEIWMRRLGEALNVDPRIFMTIPEAQVTTNMVTVDVVGTVQAGAWAEAMEDHSEDWESVTIPRPDGHSRYFGLKVRGESMNREYPDGTILVCVPIGEYNGEIEDGDHVVVQRRSQTTDLVECTVKEVITASDGKVWLWPRSTEPEHQTPIAWPEPRLGDSGDGDYSAVTAIVVADIRVRRKKRNQTERG